MVNRTYETPCGTIRRAQLCRLIFTIPKAHKSWFYDYIFSYGPYAEVLEPIEVRMEMKKRAESICNRYQD